MTAQPGGRAEGGDGGGAGERERLVRWRLILGEGAEPEGPGGEGLAAALDERDLRRDQSLATLYDGERRGGLGSSSPRVARWLGDIRSQFPVGVVRVMQHDAMDRLGLRQLLLEPELLDSVEPDLDLVTTLMELGQVIPAHSRESARAVVRAVTAQLEERLATVTRAALAGALDRAARTRRPRHQAIDWNRTVAANLRHWQPEHRTVVPERLVGHARRTATVEREIILCVDQSGSMGRSVVYSSVFAAVLAGVRAVRTRLVAFDTEVVDLTGRMADPVDVLFGLQLGGGTDINRALAYCQGLVERPAETVLVLISDLFEGGVRDEMLRRMGALADAGVTVVALLALDDSGAPAFDQDNAAALAGLGVPAFACTPDLFPDLMAAAIQRRDLTVWAGDHGLPLAAPSDNRS